MSREYGARQATPHSELIEQLMDSRVPKTEREHAARREIEMLREALSLPAQIAPEQVECMCGICKLGKREWVGLTEEEAIKLFPIGEWEIESTLELAKAIEAKLKEKNA